MSEFRIYKTQANVESFIRMVLMGISVKEICEEIGIARSTYYSWLDDPKIIAEIDKRRTEIKDEGIAYIKARYKKYLKNIDKLCDDTTDRRTCLAANQFMVEKMDGKNTAKLEVQEEAKNKPDQNVLNDLKTLAIIDDSETESEEPLRSH